jgi:hypothetical protein
MQKTSKVRQVREEPIPFEKLPWETQLMCRYFILGRERGFFLADDGKKTLPHKKRKRKAKSEVVKSL